MSKQDEIQREDSNKNLHPLISWGVIVMAIGGLAIAVVLDAGKSGSAAKTNDFDRKIDLIMGCKRLIRQKGFYELDFSWGERAIPFGTGDYNLVVPFTHKNTFGVTFKKKASCFYRVNTKQVTLRGIDRDLS